MWPYPPSPLGRTAMDGLLVHLKKRVFECDERGEYEAVKAYNDVIKYLEDTTKRKKIQVLTMGHISKICMVAPRTVTKWFDKGWLKGYRVPGSQDRRVTIQSLRDFMIEREIPVEYLDNFLTE